MNDIDLTQCIESVGWGQFKFILGGSKLMRGGWTFLCR